MSAWIFPFTAMNSFQYLLMASMSLRVYLAYSVTVLTWKRVVQTGLGQYIDPHLFEDGCRTLLMPTWTFPFVATKYRLYNAFYV